METPNLWNGLQDKMLELLQHAQQQASVERESVHLGLDPLLLSLRDAVRQGGDFVSSHIRAYEHRILELQSQIKERNRSFVVSNMRSSASFLEQEMKNLKLEQDTWKLIDVLHKCEVRHQQETPDLQSFFSEKEVVIWSKRKDQSLDWDSSVVEWLESLHTPFINVKGVGSQRMSVEKLRIQTELHRRVESLDPDAQFRSQLETDKEDEQLLVDLWSLVRGGLLSRAIELCRDYHQHWRAATLGGGEYWYDGGKANDPMKVEGNRRRVLWRASCRELAKATTSPYERSVYAILSGDLDLVFGVESLCKSWEDVCWAKFKTLIASVIDRKLHIAFLPPKQEEHNVRELIYDDLLYGQADGLFPPTKIQLTSREHIIAQLEKDFNINSDNLHMRYYHILHQLILQKSPRSFASDLTKLLFHPDFGNMLFAPQNASYLAFIVHLHIYSKYFSPSPTKNVENSQEENFLLAYYIVYLISIKAYDVPNPQEQSTIVDYFTYLPKDKKVSLYAKFLQGLGYGNGKRNHFLNAAEHTFHPSEVQAITVQLVQNLRVDKREHNSMYCVEDKLDALRWLAAQKHNCDEKVALSHTNYLFRLFWEWKGNLSHATLTPDFKPFSQSELHRYGMQLSEHISPLRPSRTTPEGWEFACWSYYYSSLRQFNIFVSHLQTPEEETGKLQREWEAARDKYRDQTQKWIRATLDLCAQRLGPTMPCVPELIDLLARMYLACGDYQQCVNLADDVADQNMRLYDFFAPSEMERFLGTMREAFLHTLPAEQVNPGPLSIHY